MHSGFDHDSRAFFRQSDGRTTGMDRPPHRSESHLHLQCSWSPPRPSRLPACRTARRGNMRRFAAVVLLVIVGSARAGWSSAARTCLGGRLTVDSRWVHIRSRFLHRIHLGPSVAELHVRSPSRSSGRITGAAVRPWSADPHPGVRAVGRTVTCRADSWPVGPPAGAHARSRCPTTYNSQDGIPAPVLLLSIGAAPPGASRGSGLVRSPRL
jgi:hypothetical protein